MIDKLLAELTRPEAYSFPTDVAEVRQTHISLVFLVRGFVYKIKKPVRFDFLDFSTLELRRHFCFEELRLNRTLAPDVYLGVVPIVERPIGLIAADELIQDHPAPIPSATWVVEWAVKMRRLPDERSAIELLKRGELDESKIVFLAKRIAAFHERADSGLEISRLGRAEKVAGNMRENFTQSASEIGLTLTPNLADRLRAAFERSIAAFGPMMDSRSDRGLMRDTHGDLRLDHVYFFPDSPPPTDILVIDRIEFNERFRWADPIADAAFPAMDLKFMGRSDLARAFIDAYTHARNDSEGRALFPLYTSYRAAVRAKVEGFELREPEIPEVERIDATHRARRHWLLALAELEPPERRPALILIGGLPGTGKSTLSRTLVDFEIIRSDIVRKELAASERDGTPDGIYTREWTDRTYAACLVRAERVLLDGGRVIVDAVFREERRRLDFLHLADRLGLPFLFVICEATSEVVRQRLAERRNDASDADWNVYAQTVKLWEKLGDAISRKTLHVDTEKNAEVAIKQRLREMELCPLSDSE